ncbi:hypothetical protein H5410_049876 [Solanum commersonii]|uniref:CCHC-type domain-containing protein n=1 Tax=Solanum commersonii TaxID=4109 RepID=A0A9J5WTV9_SOLCO|nr:hypothetical protein H5410_049876 [Solanum commersonii]
MFYYPRPTPQDVLLEEHEHIITNSYNGKEIYEWNIDGYIDRQIFTTVHRMLMYSTICKTNKNSDKTIADMITAGFTGQLKGWWDNYLNQTQRDTILMAVKQEGDQLTQNAVYTLVLNIIEHFSGRWSDNSETIRTLLQNLRCKSLTSFRYYKDVFLCRVMELPECNSTHWKSKFIDGLPTLFAERVRKSLRGDDHSINYDNYTYGKLISACVQEGLSLFSHKKKKSSKKDYEKWKKKKIEKKLRRAEEGRGDSSKRKKKYRQNFNKSDTCHKCERYGHYAKDCRVKEKIKNLDIDDNLKDSLYKIMLNSDSESGSVYSSREYSSTSEDLKALQQEEYLTSEDECSPCQQGMACENDDDRDDLYKIYEQFKELSLNVIDNDKVIELLQNIKDSEIRAQIIDKISDSKEKNHFIDKDHIPKDIPTKEGSYTMTEVKNLLLERRKMTSSPTTISDLKEEINNLKGDITRLKEKNVVIESVASSSNSGMNIDHPMYKEFMDFMKSKEKLDNNPPSYSSILIDDENIEVFDLNDKKEVILLLEESDLKWRNEPWQIMARYLDTVSYTATVYKYRMHYEMILSSIGCEFQHFYPANTKKVYNFSKLIIKREQFTVYTKFWSKLLQKNPEGKLHGQEIVDLINVTISKYYNTAHTEPQVMEDSSPFKKITRKLQMKKGLISKLEAIAIYMEEVKKDLMKNLDFEIKDDISMISASHTNEEEDACIAGEGQDVDNEEEDLETILKRYQQQLEESSSASTAGKGKEKI